MSPASLGGPARAFIWRIPSPPLVGGEAVREYRKDEHTDGEGSILFIFYISGNMPGGLRVRVCTELDKQTGFWERSSEKGGVDFGAFSPRLSS